MKLQQFTGVAYGESELELVFQLYRARKAYAGDAAKQQLLDDASALLSDLQIDDARTIVDNLLPPGDFDGNGAVDGADFLVWQRQVGSVGYYPLKQLAADGNVDGIVNDADLALWRQYFGFVSTSIGTAVSAPVPEPATLSLLFAGTAFCGLRRRRST